MGNLNFNNLSKLFRYINDNGDSITFDYAGGFLINKPSGIDTLSINLSQAQGIDQVGATIQSTNIQPRPVTITGYLVGDAQTVNKDKLLSVVRPDIGGKLFADGYYLDVYPTATPVIEPKRQLAQFQLSLLAAYPYWRKDDSTSAVLTGVQKLFKLPCNFSKTYRFGQLMKTQFVNVPNRGQVPAPFTVTFTVKGAVTNPKITNATTGKFLVVNKSLVAGETLVVEITHERTYVTSSVDGDCRGALSLSSNLFRLDVGDNVLKPEAASGLDDLQVSITLRRRSWG